MKRFSFLISCLLLIAACHKSGNTGPTAYSFTDNGDQVSGNVYVSHYIKDDDSDELIFETKLYIGDQSNNRYLNIQLHKPYPVEDNEEITGEITHPILLQPIDTGVYINADGSYSDGLNIYTSDENGTFKITELDTVNHIVSGSFQFRASSSFSAIHYHTLSGSFTKLKYTL